MERLLQMARNEAESAEIIALNSRTMPVEFRDRRFEGVTFTETFEVSLRVIRDGRVGMSYGNTLADRKTLVSQALASARYGDAVEFDFSDTPIPDMRFDNIDDTLTERPLETIADDGLALVEFFKRNGVDGPIRAGSTLQTHRIQFLNSKGVEGKRQMTMCHASAMLLLPESGVGPLAMDASYTYAPLSEERRQRVLAEYHDGLKRVAVPTRRMKLLLAPISWFMIKWRIERAVSAQSLVEHVTPLEGREGEQVFPEQVTLIDHPHRKGHYHTSLFDDEGVPTQVFVLFDRGVFKGFICDLKHARKLGRRPTGHGWKTTMWGGGIGTPVQPALAHLGLEPGQTPVASLVERMDEGIILHFPNSAHSGNIPQGDFSVNIGLGYYVKDGKVRGRVEDGMVSGNIYTLFSNLSGVSLEHNHDYIPYLLFDDVAVAGSARS